ncbi:hypothetical protein NC652_004142 [Populus alba x Populus x berolinensis]|uniref:Cupin type-1 domain-containing protein n=1 Tax=Populus tomentosa TaxID=118781 RepID=A0A8X8J082_POPTO|nr:hypothetical protein POTOM_003088 [Populus tomentosa]KAJ6966494.1 hypothetical protein NC652_004142 [Populus alba x Populus x berolinensis]
MDFDLSPRSAQQLFDGEGGSYHTWSSSEFPLLAEEKVAAGRAVLQPRGFALPHYADSSKIGYVLQGSDGIVGMVLPNSSEEVVFRVKKGDVIPVPPGALSWWYNNGDHSEEVVVVFLGETSKAHIPGEFTYFFLSGGQGIMGGFSTEFISRAYKMNEEEADKLAKSQTGILLIKLEPGIRMPHPNMEIGEKMVYNIDAALPDVDVRGGGVFKALTAAGFPFLEEAGLSVNRVKLEANAMYSPSYTADGTFQVFYVARGTGRVQVVGIGGKRVLDTKIQAGQLLVVPRFFAVAQIADSEGMEFVSILPGKSRAVEEFASKKSVWNALSPVVSQVALSVTPEFEEFFKSNMQKTTVLIPPTNYI